MHTKHSNIFWHEGVKIFGERLLDAEQGRMRVRHLENDVTKALLNVFEHGSPVILKTFLRLLHVKDAPESFGYDFQVTDTDSYRRRVNRIMLAIIADSTQRVSNPKYSAGVSRPDGCIYNDRTAILVEVKTQSPLIAEQLESHVRQYLGTATEQRVITWEDLCAAFQVLRQTKSLSAVDGLLLSQFIGLLELLGIAEFNGFVPSDFEMIGAESRMTPEDWLDFRRQFMRKAEKFTAQLYTMVKDAFPFRQLDYYPRSVFRSNPTGWTALYFHDGDRDISPNLYPNINFNYLRTGILLALNSEVQTSMSKVLAAMKRTPREFEEQLRSLSGMRLSIYFKMQYRPQDHFVLKFLPGYPIACQDVEVERVLADLAQLEGDWLRHRRTTLFEMEQGLLVRSSGEQFSAAELRHAATRNPKPKLTLHIEKRYTPERIAAAGKRIVRIIAADVRRAGGYMRLVVGERDGRAEK